MKQLVLIPSVINLKKTSLSIFSNEDRLEQLKELTLPSVRKHIKDSYIVLLEGSDIDLPDLDVDFVWKVPDTQTLEKSYGEIFLIYSFLASSAFLELKNTESFSYVYKLSGRYQINENFNQPPEDKFLAKKVDNTWSGHSIFETRLYSLPASYLDTFIAKLLNILTEGMFIDIEHSFFHYGVLPVEQLHNTELLGVEGQIAPTGQLINE